MVESNDGEAGFHPIGSLATSIANTLHPRDTEATGSKLRRNASAITTSRKAPSWPTGTQHGGCGSSVPQILAAAVANRDPEAVDRALVMSLPPSISSRLSERRVDCSTREYGWDYKFSGYDLRRGAARDDVVQALYLIDAATRPCAAEVAERELLRLKLAVKSRAMDANELAFQLAIFAEELAAYPEDIVVSSIRTLAKRETWWPALSDLTSLLESKMHRRSELLRVLRQAAAR